MSLETWCPRVRALIFPATMLLLLASLCSSAEAQTGEESIRITDVDVLSDERVRVVYRSADAADTLDIPADVLKQIVERMAERHDGGQPPQGPTETAGFPQGDRSAPRKVGAVRAHSAITGEDFQITIVADSVATIRFQRAGAMHVVSLPPDLFPLLEAHHRALTGRLQDTEAQFWLDQQTGRIHFGFVRGFDYRWVLAVLAILAGVVVTILIRIAVWRVKRERNELLASRRHLAQVREAERSHLASELHDGPIQDLQRILRSYMGELSGLTTDERKARLAEIEYDLRQVAGSLRNICTDLKPPVLVHFGLARAIESFSRDFMTRNPQTKVDIVAEPDADRLTMEIRLVLYRIFQEALTNVEKHAEADRVEVRLSREGDSVQLAIRDNGEGFKVPSRIARLEHSGHFGLSGMRHRVQAVGGRFDVVSRVGYGTRVFASVPYRRAEEELMVAEEAS